MKWKLLSGLLSLVSKPGKLGSFRAVHNFSYPHIPSPSINYTIDASLDPCTWGTFATICYTIHNLPPGSQASIWDVAEAYCTIPIVHSQWLGLVVKLREDNSFAINTCNNFGLTSASGIFGFEYIVSSFCYVFLSLLYFHSTFSQSLFTIT